MTPEQEAMERARKGNAKRLEENKTALPTEDELNKYFSQPETAPDREIWDSMSDEDKRYAWSLTDEPSTGYMRRQYIRQLPEDRRKSAKGINMAQSEAARTNGQGVKGVGYVPPAEPLPQGEPNKEPENLNTNPKIVSQFDDNTKTNVDTSEPDVFNPNKLREYLENTRSNYDAVNDYYKNSATNAWNELGKGDQRIMLFDQLGTMLRNNAQYKPKLYGAFGNVVDEGQAAGTEKSKLDNFLSENLKKGLERRNTRLNDSLNTQLEMAGFEPKLEMGIRQLWDSLKTNNRAKAHLIDVMKNVNFRDALKAGFVSNPTGTINDIKSILLK